jgi:hypothetical protein
VGLSGGGLRSTLLQATCDEIRAAVVVGLMSTYEGLLDHNVVSHTWMLYPARLEPARRLARSGRLPRPVAAAGPVRSGRFAVHGRGHEGRGSAHRRALRLCRTPNNYAGQFYPGPHKFDREMQAAAFAWLGQH